MLTAMHSTLVGLPITDLYQIGLVLAVIPLAIAASVMLTNKKSPRSAATDAKAESLITE